MEKFFGNRLAAATQLKLPKFRPWMHTKKPTFLDFSNKFAYPTETTSSDERMYTVKEHFDFNTLLPILRELKELHLTYSNNLMGMNFEWRFLRMTLGDAIALGSALQKSRLKVGVGFGNGARMWDREAIV